MQVSEAGEQLKAVFSAQVAKLQQNSGSVSWQPSAANVVATGVDTRIYNMRVMWTDNMPLIGGGGGGTSRFDYITAENGSRGSHVVTLSFVVEVSSLSAGAQMSAFIFIDDGYAYAAPEPCACGPLTQSGAITKFTFSGTHTFTPGPGATFALGVRSHAGTGTVLADKARLNLVIHKATFI